MKGRRRLGDATSSPRSMVAITPRCFIHFSVIVIFPLLVLQLKQLEILTVQEFFSIFSFIYLNANQFSPNMEDKAIGRELDQLYGTANSSVSELKTSGRWDTHSKQLGALNGRTTIGQPITIPGRTATTEKRAWQRPSKIDEKRLRTFWSPNRNLDNTDFSSYPVLKSNILPDMTTKMGGIIFFLHVPKTGGKSIRFGFDRREHEKKSLIFLRKKMSPAKLKEEIDKVSLSRDILENTGEKTNSTESLERGAWDLLIAHRVRFISVRRLHTFLYSGVPKINNWLERDSNNGEVLFVEVHGMDNYNALELEPYIQFWRERSRITGVPFFSFTVLREPIASQVSFFNFYHIFPGDPRFCENSFAKKFSNRCYLIQKEAYEKNLDSHIVQSSIGRVLVGNKTRVVMQVGADAFLAKLRSRAGRKPFRGKPKGAAYIDPVSVEAHLRNLTYENPQCLFLARGERTFGDGIDKALLRSNLTQEECYRVYQSLRRTMDWIGRTDRLSEETLPILTKMMFGNVSIGRKLPRANVSPTNRGFFNISDMTHSTIQVLEEKSQWDKELFSRVIQDYRIGRWVNGTRD